MVMLSVNPETFVAICSLQDKSHASMRSALNATHAELKKNISQGSAQSSNYSISDVKVEFEKQATEIILKKLSASAVTSAAT